MNQPLDVEDANVYAREHTQIMIVRKVMLNISITIYPSSQCTPNLNFGEGFKCASICSFSQQKAFKFALSILSKVRFDAFGICGLSHLQKCTFAGRMLAYATSTDIVDEYIRIHENTTMECLLNFIQGVEAVFRAEYLRKLNADDVQV